MTSATRFSAWPTTTPRQISITAQMKAAPRRIAIPARTFLRSAMLPQPRTGGKHTRGLFVSGPQTNWRIPPRLLDEGTAPRHDQAAVLSFNSWELVSARAPHVGTIVARPADDA